MKKIILLLFAFIVHASYGQEIAANPYGLKAGINFSTLSGDSTEDDALRETHIQSGIGFYVGGYYHHPLNEKFALQPELLLSYQGATIEISKWQGVPVEAEGKVDLPYILLPIAIQYKPMDRLQVMAGPQLGYNLSKFIDIKGTVVLENETIDLETRLEDIARWDIGAFVGATYQFYPQFNAEFRFSQSFNSLDQRDEDAFELYNRVFSLGVGYNF